MSYASDNCMQHFSFDQKAAIAIDIAQRTWVSNSPNGTTDLSAVAPPQALMPLNNALHGPLSDPSIQFGVDAASRGTMALCRGVWYDYS